MIGIGITTRNRAPILEVTLKHFDHFKPKNEFVLFVSDDNSTDEFKDDNRLICEKYNVNYKYNDSRQGIAKNKNQCIEFCNTYNCDYLFLFDDDCFPKADNWDMEFIDVCTTKNMHHLMWLINVGDIRLVENNGIYATFNNCLGVCLFFDRYAIDKLQGYRKEFGIYGFEHAEISHRAKALGLTDNKGPYLAPSNIGDFIYSLDINYNFYGTKPPFWNDEQKFISSLEGEGHLISKYISENSIIYGQCLNEIR